MYIYFGDSVKQINIQYYKTPYTHFILGSFENKLCLLDFKYKKTRATIDNKLKKNLKAQFIEKDDEILKKTKQQIDEYFNKQRKKFDIPIITVGTEFQKSVWSKLIEIPYGTTSTYAQLAKNIGKEKAVRAVANANGANCINLIIPCHRIIGSNGELTGYSGGLALKKQLLYLENSLLQS